MPRPRISAPNAVLAGLALIAAAVFGIGFASHGHLHLTGDGKLFHSHANFGRHDHAAAHASPTGPGRAQQNPPDVESPVRLPGEPEPDPGDEPAGSFVSLAVPALAAQPGVITLAPPLGVGEVVPPPLAPDARDPRYTRSARGPPQLSVALAIA